MQDSILYMMGYRINLIISRLEDKGSGLLNLVKFN
jgi:hypothetical protein